MASLTYLAILAGCVVITLPLELFGARVYRRPLRLIHALAPPLVVFVVWDLVAIGFGVWDYNPALVTGIELPGDLPLEELLFFVVIPLCALLTYETVERLLPRLRALLHGSGRDPREEDAP